MFLLKNFLPKFLFVLGEQ